MASSDFRTQASGTSRLLKASLVGVLFSLAAALFLLASPVPAHAITLDDVNCTWSNVVGGSNINSSANASQCEVRWGVSTGSGQSGLRFNEPAGMPTTVFINTPFNLGTLTHLNRPIAAGSAASGAQLNLSVTLNVPPVVGGGFVYTFGIDETPNVFGTCVYPSTTPCADKISFSNPMPPSAFFSIGGVDYTLQILGFSTDGGATITTEFISQEGNDNSADLYARLRARSDVPAPSALSLFAIGLAGLAARRRRK